MFFTIDLSEFTPSGVALNHFFPAFGTSESKIKRRVVCHYFWWTMLLIGQIGCDRTAIIIVKVFEHLWLAFSDISCVFTSSRFCLALGGKLHVTKPVSISFQPQISPAEISLLLSRPHAEIDTIVHPNCIQKCSWRFISEHSCAVEFLYFFIC